MKRNRILNLGLNQALAAMGHGDFMIVCNAGFPIPAQVSRVDLAIVADVPDLETVLTAISADFIAAMTGAEPKEVRFGAAFQGISFIRANEALADFVPLQRGNKRCS